MYLNINYLVNQTSIKIKENFVRKWKHIYVPIYINYRYFTYGACASNKIKYFSGFRIREV